MDEIKISELDLKLIKEYWEKKDEYSKIKQNLDDKLTIITLKHQVLNLQIQNLQLNLKFLQNDKILIEKEIKENENINKINCKEYDQLIKELSELYFIDLKKCAINNDTGIAKILEINQ